MKDLFTLKNKNALITGSTRGIGLLLARGLAQFGARVIINGSSSAGTEKAVAELAKENINAYGMPFDITRSSEVRHAIDVIESDLGSIDILINNAGIQRRHLFVDFPEEEWDDVIKVNQKAVFIVSQAVVPSMIERKAGKIINIGSMQSELGRETIIPYAASKGAVKMLTRGMCVELARHNIQVNCIAPGYFSTDMTRGLVENQAFSQWLCKRTPAARWGDPQELIGAAVFLSSQASDFVNGQMLFVDGGMSVAV